MMGARMWDKGAEKMARCGAAAAPCGADRLHAAAGSLRAMTLAFSAMLSAILLAVALVAIVPVGVAWAEDDDNLLNPQQRPDSSFIYDTPISALSSADTYYDDQTVQVVGEAVGDSINATLDGDHQWVMVSATEQGAVYNIAVYMTREAASHVDTFGRYGTTGTTLQVRGTFHLVCEEHDGVSDIHADAVTVTQRGSEHADQLDLSAFAPGLATVLLGLALMGVFYYLRERQR